MNRYIKQIVILVTLSILVACAGTGEREDGGSSGRGDCIQQSSIRGYRVLDEQNLIVDVSARRKYHVVLQRRAFGLRSSWGIGFKESSTGRICAGFSEVVFEGQGIGGGIRIASIRQLTPEEEEGLLISYGLKEPEVKSMPAPQDVEGADIEELDPDAKD